VLSHRAATVERLYAGGDGVILPRPPAAAGASAR
jgi:hypothetical protein